MSLNSSELLKTIYKGVNPEEKTKRLATVISVDLTKGRQVRFYGEEFPTEKFYKVAFGVSAAVGNTVIMEKINGNYIITGRV